MDGDYFRKTVTSTLWLAMLAVAVLIQLGAYWALIPALAGVALSVVLLLGWIGLARCLVVPRGPGGANRAVSGFKARLLFALLAMVKYPLVGLLIWWLTRIWETRQLAALVGGFLLLQVVIVGRAVGKLRADTGEEKADGANTDGKKTDG